jgi:FKBP-type peptidyl-prolyl cis-trans isomerase FkpA
MPKMTKEEAREYYLAEKTYFVHERAKAYQEQFLLDLSKQDRQYKLITKMAKGSTAKYTSAAYNMIRLGNQDRISRALKSQDTVTMVYTIRNERGKAIVETDTVRLAFREIKVGLQDIVKIGRDGAKFNAWVASEAAYGTAGDKELGIGPNELLNYDVEILDIKYNEPKSKSKSK